MPDSTPPSSPPPTAAPAQAPAGSDALAGMVAQVQALRAQAQATQQTLRTLREQDEDGSWHPALPEWDAAQATTLVALLLGLAAAWWYLWHRPQRRLSEPYDDDPPSIPAAYHPEPVSRKVVTDFMAPSAALPEPPPAPAPPVARPAVASPPAPKPADSGGTADADDWSPASQLMPMDHGMEISHDANHSVFARMEPVIGFDRDAAADEVHRVRMSLARKREARAQQYMDGDSFSSGTQTYSIAIDPEPQAAESSAALTAPGELDFSLPDAAQGSELPLQPASSAPHAMPDAGTLPNDMPTSFSLPQPDLSAHEAKPDLGITLALALESEALSLWQEARELAHEVLEGGDTEQMIQAQTLLNRLDAREEEARQAQLETPLHVDDLAP